MSELNSESAIIRSRIRLKLRRIKSLALIKSQLSDVDGEIISGEGKCTKKIRNDRFSMSKKATIKCRPSASPLWDKLSEDDVIDVGKSTGENLRRVTCWSNGSVSMIGRRREMEDAVAVELRFLENYDFFGVYDGHGGSRVADACREGLHNILRKQVKDEELEHGDEKKAIDWEKVIISSFERMDEEVNKGGSPVAMTGSTAVVAVVGEEELVVANCGDSRAVLSRDGVAVALSDDHKPDRPGELKRIEASGGMVLNWYGHRVSGVLATSRSIGDYYLKPFVISEPEVRVIKKTNKDEFLILASDGLWDVISNDHACQIIRNYLEGQRRKRSQEITHETIVDARSCAARAAALLAELAISRGSRDNISVIVIELKRSGCCNHNELK